MNHTDIFLGVALLQFIYIAYQLLLFKRPEYFYYLVYFSIIASVVFFKIHPDYDPFRVFVTIEEPFTAGRGLWMFALAYYFRFGRYFIEVERQNNQLNNKIVWAERILICCGTADIMTQAFRVDYGLVERFSFWIFIAAIPFSAYVIIRLFMRGDLLTNILITGSGLLLSFSACGLLLIKLYENVFSEGDLQLFTEIGVVSELLFLNYGLIYKTRVIQKENIRNEIERALDLNRQRMEISRDLHDEVGAALTSISFLSEINIRDQRSGAAATDTIKKIGELSRETINAIKDIVWAISPANDSLDKMTSKMQEYGMTIVSARQQSFHFFCDDSLNELSLSMIKRKNLYLVFKEAVSNAAKYAGGGGTVRVELKLKQGELHMLINDDGVGFDPAGVEAGNGLVNMGDRAGELGGRLFITSKPGIGTSIELSFPIA